MQITAGICLIISSPTRWRGPFFRALLDAERRLNGIWFTGGCPSPFLKRTRENLLTPIEVKMTDSIRSVDLTLMKEFVKKEKQSFGIVIYGGAPFVDREQKVVFYPYWMI